MMMMMMCRVMCVLAVVLCCACGYTMAAAAAVDNDSPSGRGVSRGAVEVSCGAGGALRVRPAAESEWLTCGAGSRVSACGKYADLCRQRTARAATTTRITTTTANGQPKAVMAFDNFPRDGTVFEEFEKGFYQKPKKEEEKTKTPNDTNRLQQQEQHVQNHEVTSGPGEGITNGDHPAEDSRMKSSAPQTDPVDGRENSRSWKALGDTTFGGTGLYSAWDGDAVKEVAVCLGDVAEENKKFCSQWLEKKKQNGSGSHTSFSHGNADSQHLREQVHVNSVVSHVPPKAEELDQMKGDKEKQDLAGEVTGTGKDTPLSEVKTEPGHPLAQQGKTTNTTTTSASLNNVADNHPQSGEHENSKRSASPSITDAEVVEAQKGASTTTIQSTTQESNVAPQDIQSSSNTKGDNSAVGKSTLTQQSSPANVDETVAPDTEETNHTTPPSPENNVSDAPTTTPSTVPNAEITSIASNMQNKANVDSSISPVWMRTAAPLLIVAVLFSVTVY
ncbi:uncharacterized protein TM35_001491030 [Trypanosoma theileri]|uniref:Mucin-associated surface protein (MASP) n=1 Tax=Trypanosoma theileri TaxID=67003 RepID=A0A1X0NEV5_9TRYP|nr:uncharacterized protein TM35_001491030 [Trypanosoma theileri]ORC80726.1 hypothetical protein TM35_001491030 [Trypanosoma theileri]